MTGSRVSCILPAWNAAATIARSIESILAQTVLPLEVIVVDDGSTDDTRAVVSRFGAGVRSVRQPNAGAEAARNRGIAESRGEFLAFLDADDVWLPTKLERQLAVFRDRPEVGAVGCLVHHVGDVDDAWVDRQMIRYAGREVPGWRGSDVMARRTAFEAVGRFDPALRHAGMIQWLQRCEAAGIPRFLLPECLVERHLRPGSTSTQQSAGGTTANLDEYLTLVRARLSAHRSGPGANLPR